MENASKALIIAGAILLAILIISLGIMIYNQAAGVVDSNAMDEVAVSSFNQKFTQYEGENVRGANVKSLLSTIAQNNLTNSGDASKQVSVTFDGTGLGKITDATKATVLTGKSYSVKFVADSKSGYVTTVTITQLK
jgi:hypothetical protein